ncbi:Ig-like domain-containing protein [Algicella marina]|uniref:Uncharacterized protein n=1 Tax=Algicella marina TaxID=2683284 RepID=A0A6P1T5P7_9RHOB|nr:Ig-like domain-containing protein [Algicella marina]QHQ35872.1 hypothetical protein GO499_12150 [Algicella marina]
MTRHYGFNSGFNKYGFGGNYSWGHDGGRSHSGGWGGGNDWGFGGGWGSKGGWDIGGWGHKISWGFQLWGRIKEGGWDFGDWGNWGCKDDPVVPVIELEAIKDEVTVAEGDTIAFNVLDNDVAAEGAVLTLFFAGYGELEIALGETVEFTSDAGNSGLLTVEENGDVTFDPEGDFTAEDLFVFSYAVRDAEGNTTNGDVVITVTPDLEAVKDDVTIDEDGIAVLNVLENDIAASDAVLTVFFAGFGEVEIPIGDTFEFTSLGGRTAALTLEADGDLVVDPLGDFADLDEGETDMFVFTYAVTDADGVISGGDVSITVNGVTELDV